MKKLTVLVTALALLAGNTASAQNSGNMGKGAKAAKTTASDNFAWGIAVAGLALLGVVVGVAAAAGSSNGSSFSH